MPKERELCSDKSTIRCNEARKELLYETKGVYRVGQRIVRRGQYS